MNQKLYRSTRDRKVCGLLSGIGEWLGMDVTLLRVLFVIGAFFSVFSLVAIYFIVSLVVPKEPNQPFEPQDYGAGPHGGYYASSNDSSIDSMMMDIEKKALKKEIEELRQKVAEYERGDK